MKTLALVCLLVVLSGCAVSDFVPSLQYCDYIRYERQGTEFSVMAACRTSK